MRYGNCKLPCDRWKKPFSIASIGFASLEIAPRDFASLKNSATVREIVDLPVPAIPFNQKTHRSCGEKAQSLIWRRTSVRVPGRHLSSH